MDKQSAISLPIELGDIVLSGRFKNKKVLVKSIGVDEHGSPTINGRSILSIRMQKKPETTWERLKRNIVSNVINESF